MQESPFRALAQKWASTFVAREQVSNFSGGILNSGTLANLDRQGKGPSRRIRIGRKIAYPIDSLIEWMESRATYLEV